MIQKSRDDRFLKFEEQTRSSSSAEKNKSKIDGQLEIDLFLAVDT